MKAFKAYDIRGVFNQDWNLSDAYGIGFFIPRLLKTNKVLVGRDVRISSNDIFASLTDGIRDAGADVVDLGLCSTPMVYWATAKYSFKASVQITASHNPKEYNGLKVSGEEAFPIGYEGGLKQIQNWLSQEKIVPESTRGEFIQWDLHNEYLEFLRSYFQIRDLKVKIDISNGMAGLFIRDIFMGNADYLNAELDGEFPAHDPNPLKIENVRQLSQAVINDGYDLGIIFDGDADRVMFVDENGTFISPDLMIAVLGEYFLTAQNHQHVLQDIRTSRSVAEHLEKFGAKIHTWRVGRAFASPKLREIDGVFGGELAGHYYFRDFYYSDSGILASILIYRILGDYKAQGKTVSQVIRSISHYYSTGELNYTVKDKQGVMQKVVEDFIRTEKPDALLDFDGYRLDYPNFWFNIRPSNTEPYLRFIAEAKTEELLNSIKQRVENLIRF